MRHRFRHPAASHHQPQGTAYDTLTQDNLAHHPLRPLRVIVRFTHAAVASLPIVLPALTCDALSATDFSAAVGAKVTINHTEMQTSAQGSWCKVSATIAPEIGVQIALPTQRWSQRFLQVGCGGLCGSINLSLSNASGCLPAMNGEFVVAATDMGHHAV